MAAFIHLATTDVHHLYLDFITLLDPNELLAELQLSFVMLLIGQNFSAFEHWKSIVHLLTGCVEALSDSALQNSLFVPLIKTLRVSTSLNAHRIFSSMFYPRITFIAASLEVCNSFYVCIYSPISIIYNQLTVLFNFFFLY